MRKLIIIAVITLLYGILPAQVRWNFRTAIQGGYNSNIFKSPEDLDEADSIIKPVTSDLLRSIELDARVRYYISSQHRVSIDYGGKDVRYNQYPNANQYRHGLRLSYRFKISKTSTFYLNSNAIYSRKLGTNVLGEGLTRIYTSLGYRISPRFVYQTSKKVRQSIEYSYREKNYQETLGYESIDYQEQRLIFSNLYYLKTSKLYRNIELLLEYRNRQFIEYTARNLLGDQQPGYPQKHYHYYTLSLGYNHKFQQHDFEIYTWFRYRKDPFQGYYSYNEYRIWSRFGGILWKKTFFDIYASYKHRYYLNKIAPQDPLLALEEPDLIWDNADAKTAIRYEFTRYFSFVLTYILDFRGTNTTDISSTTNRAYLTHAFLASVLFHI